MKFKMKFTAVILWFVLMWEMFFQKHFSVCPSVHFHCYINTALKHLSVTLKNKINLSLRCQRHNWYLSKKTVIIV